MCTEFVVNPETEEDYVYLKRQLQYHEKPKEVKYAGKIKAIFQY